MWSKKYADNERVISAFLNNCRTVDIVKDSGLSRTTVNRLQKDPEFLQALRERRTAIVSGAVIKLQQNLSKDVDVLQEIIEDPEISPQVRVNAIQVSLSQLRDWTTTENIMKRLDKLQDPNRPENQFDSLFSEK